MEPNPICLGASREGPQYFTMSILIRLQLFLGTSEAYKSLFKAGFVLVAASVIALAQIGPVLVANDLAAYRLKFETEFAMKRKIDKQTNCFTTGEQEASCRMVQHHLELLAVSTDLWVFYMKSTLYVGVVLMNLGMLGFLMPLFGQIPAKQ